MKRVAYVAANILTVAGWDFPRHIWSAFSPLFFFWCLRSLNVQARQVYSSGEFFLTPIGGARKQHTPQF